MKKKLLTLEDLAKFCKEQRMLSFSSKDHNGEPLCVSVPATFKKKEAKNTSLMYLDIWAFHTGRNRNGSSVTEEAMKASLSTFAYKPLLAAFTTDKNGDEDFMAHEMEQDKDGNIVYIEQQVGSFVSDLPTMEPDDEDEEKQWAHAVGVIPREYTHAADILERKDGTKGSVELYINEFSYDEDEDLLLLKDIEVSGYTFLGVSHEGADPEKESVEEGMKGSRADIKDFSKENNSSFNFEGLKDVIKEAVENALHDINTQRKEENNQMSHFDELLEKYGKTIEEITFAYEGLSDEELDAAFAEAFEETPENENENLHNVDFAVTFNGETKNFSKSLNETIREITELVNATYGSEDNAWYDCEVFEDKTVMFHDWWNNKHFKQKYGNKDGKLTLKGERTEVFVRFLTEEEIAALDDLKSKFEAQTKELEDVNAKFEEVNKELDLYKAEPEKIDLLNSEDYAKVRKSAEFEELSKRENYFSLTKDELSSKLDGILLDFAKKQSRESESESNSTVSVKRFGSGTSSSGTGRYGNTFAKKES